MATDNHDFAQPARGAENWDQDWYNNFDALDERVILRGPATDRNNYTAYADSLYFATDTEELYRGTGTTWEQLASFGSDPTLGSVSADELHSTTEPVVSVKAHGAVGDASTDDTQAIQDAIAHLPADGGTVYFPQGTYRTTAPIAVRKRNVKLRGNGRRNIQDSAYVGNDLGPETPATIAPDHTDEAVVVEGDSPVNGFGASGLTFHGEMSGTQAAAGIAFRIYNNFRRDFVLRELSIEQFDIGVRISRVADSTEPAIGALRLRDCNIMHNTRAVSVTDDPDAQVNTFEMRGCDAGQNGYNSGGGVRMRGSAITIENNILEGQRDAVVCTGAFNNVSVKNNYFEANVGEACIQLIDYRGPFDIGPNYYGDVSQNVSHRVTIYNNARGGMISDTYFPKVAHNIDWPTLHAGSSQSRMNSDTTDQMVHTKRVEPNDARTLEEKLLNDRVVVDTTNDPIHATPLGDLHVKEIDTSTTTRIDTSASWGPSVGDWVGFSALLKTNVAGVSPAAAILMDASSDSNLGSFTQTIYGYNRAHAETDWTLITAATRVDGTVDRPYMYLYPHGLSPSTTGTAYVTTPYLWHVGDVNHIRPNFPASGFQ